jgi:hypothetical protein
LRGNFGTNSPAIRSKKPIARLPGGENAYKEAEASALARNSLAEQWSEGVSTRSRKPVPGLSVRASQRSHIHATALTPSQLADAKDAFTKLNGANLTEAVRFYLAHAKPARGTQKNVTKRLTHFSSHRPMWVVSRVHLCHLGWSLKKVAAAFPKRLEWRSILLGHQVS